MFGLPLREHIDRVGKVFLRDRELLALLQMDRIIVFSQEKIVEDGTHSQLLAQNGHYKKLWNTQIGGFLADQN